MNKRDKKGNIILITTYYLSMYQKREKTRNKRDKREKNEINVKKRDNYKSLFIIFYHSNTSRLYCNNTFLAKKW